MRAPISTWGFACALGLAVLALACDALADPHGPPSAAATVPVAALRTGEHPGFCRVVFDLPPSARAETTSLPDGLRVHVAGAALHGDGRVPRGLDGLSIDGDGAALSWPAGSTVHVWRMSGRLVIDILRPHGGPDRRAHAAAPPMAITGRLREPANPPWTPSAQRPSSTTPHKPSQLASAPPPPPATVAPADVAAAPRVAVTSTPAPALDARPEPLAIAARPAPAPGDAGAAVLPFAATTGAAAFRRGAWGMAVFDEGRPIDLGLLRDDPALAGAEVHQLPAATVVRLRLRPDQALRLSHRPDGWSLAVTSAPPPAEAIRPAVKAGVLDLPLADPGRVVSVPDPDTGALLLIGTQAAAAGGADSPAEAIAVERHTPAFSLLASWRGIAVAPLADSIALRTTRAGFVLESAGGPASLPLAGTAGPAADVAARYSRRFDLPDEPLLALGRRLRAAEDMAASQPEQGRGPARLRVAEAMLGLGMGAEAEAVVRLACTDDPRLVADPQAQALRGAAALLAGRVSEAAPLDDPALTAPGQPGTDEVELWRALRAARLADLRGAADPAAAQVIGAKLPLLQAYPEPLRNRLLPLAVRTLANGGEAAAARRAVDADPADPRLDLTRALLDERDGRTADALARLDRLAAGDDRDIAARAAVRAVNLRLRQHQLTPRQAADALDPLIYAWRGDRRELAVRLREAALRMEAGQPREALALLRDSSDPVLAQGWPEQLADLHRQMGADFAQALADDAKAPMRPLEFVAMVRENADLLPDGAPGAAIAERVADRLAALDLPEQAAAALQRVMSGAPAGAARAALGGRLAALQLEQHDPAAALLTLSASIVPGLPPSLLESRTLTFARATAQRGDLDAATAALAALGTPGAADLRAHLLENAGRWPQATTVLDSLADRRVPPAGALDDAQVALLLRLASAAAEAGNQQVLATLRLRDLPRIPPGHSADLLRLLTAGPVRSVADLPRAGAEIALARTVLK